MVSLRKRKPPGPRSASVCILIQRTAQRSRIRSVLSSSTLKITNVHMPQAGVTKLAEVLKASTAPWQYEAIYPYFHSHLMLGPTHIVSCPTRGM